MPSQISALGVKRYGHLHKLSTSTHTHIHTEKDGTFIFHTIVEHCNKLVGGFLSA